MRIFCDEQLGRLAKWLRIQGHDAAFQCPINDEELIRKAHSENRVILTRDRHLSHKTLGKVIVIESTRYPDQLVELKKKVRLPKKSLFSRCLECNALLQLALKREVQDKVPQEVYNSYDKFFACPVCKKVFWRGSHVKNTEKRIRPC